jgi:penicillin-binding protein-related factor A (putative recombinase)
MSQPTNETGLVKAIRNAITVKYPDAWVMKVHGGPFQQVGTPDILVCVKGQLFAFEVKHRKPGESAQHAMDRVTTAQWSQIERMRRAGAVADVVMAVDEVLHIIEAEQ